MKNISHWRIRKKNGKAAHLMQHARSGRHAGLTCNQVQRSQGQWHTWTRSNTVFRSSAEEGWALFFTSLNYFKKFEDALFYFFLFVYSGLFICFHFFVPSIKSQWHRLLSKYTELEHFRCSVQNWAARSIDSQVGQTFDVLQDAGLIFHAIQGNR